MAEKTEISWAHSTFNPWIGCTKVSPGCDHCYAATLMDERYKRVKWGAGEARGRTSAANWKQPLAWNRKAKESGEPWRVFCASLADVFDNEAPDEWRADLFRLIEETPALTWMLLTKRIGNVRHMLPPEWLPKPGVWVGSFPPNVWLGITVVNQGEYDRDYPKLESIDAPVRWLSCEPLLGPINHFHAGRPDWVIVGGESGAGARPMEVEWVRGIRSECERTGATFHFKQWGEWRGLARLGKKAAGHLLDGVEYRAFPVVA
jgi:protein gp37